MFLLSFLWPRQLSRDVRPDAGFLHRDAVLEEKIHTVPCPFLTSQCLEVAVVTRCWSRKLSAGVPSWMLPLLKGYHQSPAFQLMMSLAEITVESTLMSYKYCKNKIEAFVVGPSSLPASQCRTIVWALAVILLLSTSKETIHLTQNSVKYKTFFSLSDFFFFVEDLI